ncbi:hypothetical protein CIW48_27260 [Methylobacterium sp. P1-11]|uniref:hypothetical protein n=1 Tax=Methylobacterium sp. P1-11 TaxID=2024616 RepID=UPI0011EEC16B|nr:hypothetical protein [Methylobacterium sp. P1-11]KAA0117902.1 hypothetical protein CIW48_27260 [Methylobacterium sp. P1-11]
MSEWQDIATAPKATPNLRFGIFGPVIVLSDRAHEIRGYWREMFDMDDGDGGTDWLPEGWVSETEAELLAWTPTRWRPA